MISKNSALLVIDVQNDFCPGGALPVPKGDKVIPVINRIGEKFSRVVATQDWHPENHISFASNHRGKSEYDTLMLNGEEQVLWPDHCVQGTEGAGFHPELNRELFHMIIRKGFDPDIDSYSAFLDNDKKSKTGLDGYLKSLNIENVYVSGLALDYCVFYSALDSIKFGFNTHLILDASRGIDSPEGSIDNALEIMKKKGIKIIKTDNL